MEAAKEALRAWEHLQEFAASLSPAKQEIEDKLSQSLVAKRKLADDTKNFKRLPDTERLSSVPELLKSYQVEIDAISKRSKIAEAAFSDLLKAVNGAPAVSIVVEQLHKPSIAQSRSGSDGQTGEKDAQIAKLRKEVDELEEELKTVTNQAVTVRRLQKQVKDAEVASEARIAEAKKHKDEEWTKRLEELRQELGVQREQQVEELTKLLEQRELRDNELDRLRQQRLEEQGWAEQTVLARSLEVETLNNDIDKLQAELESERLQRLENNETLGSSKVMQALLDAAQQRAYSLDREVVELRRQLGEADERAQQYEQEKQAELGKLGRVVAAKDAEIQIVKEQLSLRPSFDEVTDLRQQIHNVEVVELADVGSATTDLERRLLQRQRVLEGQLSDARVRFQELEDETKGLGQQLLTANDEAKDQRQLVARLESELRETAKPAAPVPEQQLAALLPLVGATDAAMVGTGEAADSAIVPMEGAREAMPSMMDIVAGQRDRLRERVGDLEQERDRWRSAAEQERKRADTLHADNVKMLERTRYLQTFQPKQGGGGTHGRARGRPGAVDIEMEGRYGAAYEDGLGPVGPYEQFREDEKARRVASMNAGERLLVTSGSLLFASKPARMFTLGYASTLHLLVFLVLYRLALKPC